MSDPKKEVFIGIGDEQIQFINGVVLLNYFKLSYEYQQLIILDEPIVNIVDDIKYVTTSSTEDVLNTICFKTEEDTINYIGDAPFEYTITEINQVDKEWIDGLKFDSYQEARAAYDGTEADYNKSKAVTSLSFEDMQRLFLVMLGEGQV